MHNITGKLVVVFISLLFGLLTCEALVRILPIPQFDKTQIGVVQPHLTRGFEFIPNVAIKRWGVDWNINSKGFRDYEHAVAKERYRILGLGDSFFVGHEVSFENSFLRQLEKILDVEVIKMAVTNYGTVQERLLWEEEGRLYRPDLVLLGVYLANDLGDNVAFLDHRCVDQGNFVRCGDPAYRGVRLSRRLARHSLLARLLLQRFHTFLPQYAAKDVPEDSKPAEDPVFRRLNSQDPIYQKPWSEVLAREFRLLEENVLELNRSVAAEGAALIVVIIPAEIQIYDDLWPEYLKRFSTDDSKLDRYYAHNSLVEFLEANQIRTIDLLPALKKAGEADRELHPEHWHWSVKANRLVAETVADHLRSRRMIPLTTAAH